MQIIARLYGVLELASSCNVHKNAANNEPRPCLQGPGFPPAAALPPRLDRAPRPAVQPAARHLPCAAGRVRPGAAPAGGQAGRPGLEPALLGAAERRLPAGERGRWAALAGCALGGDPRLSKGLGGWAGGKLQLCDLI